MRFSISILFLQGTDLLQFQSGTNKGTLFVGRSDGWHPICDRKFNLNNANVACKSMGFQRAKSFTAGISEPSENERNISQTLVIHYSCRGNESSLDHCKQVANKNSCQCDLEMVTNNVFSRSMQYKLTVNTVFNFLFMKRN